MPNETTAPTHTAAADKISLDDWLTMRELLMTGRSLPIPLQRFYDTHQRDVQAALAASLRGRGKSA